MLKIFYKNNGAISVFLTLILLPVLIMGGMTVDASRIYMSKVVISDAGEMAMNAGLAQYDEKLHDEYGLLVMDESPEAMAEELEAFFTGSLNGTGLPETEDYDRILDLLTKNFEAINVQGSEIYQTEVEKQQILEYMKYRAPIYLAELLAEKLEMLRDTKKMAEAMEAQLDFSQAMEECQDEFDEAKETLDTLNQDIMSFPDTEGIKKELSDTEKDYKEIVSRCLLMREAIQNYDNRSSHKGSGLKEMAEKFIASAERVSFDTSAVYQESNFDSYIDCLDYRKAVDDLGGIQKLLEGEGTEEESEEPAEDSGTSEEESKELEDIVKKYRAEEERLFIDSSYPNALNAAAKQYVDSHSSTLQSLRGTAEQAEQTAKEANKQLKKVKEKLEKAAKQFSKWEKKTNELKSVGKAGEMENNVDEYSEFFSNGEGKSNLENLDVLVSKVQEDESYFGEWNRVLEKEKFFGQAIATVPSATQLGTYIREAKSSASGAEARYASLETVRRTYISNYEHIEASNSYGLKEINSDEFYRKLKEYCEKKEEEDSTAEQEAANQNLEEGKSAAEEAKMEDPNLTYNWSEAGVTLPSTLAGADMSGADGALADLNASSDVNNSQARKNTIQKFKDSIHAANSFLGAVDQILSKTIENLYIAEYAMQMFSYYTVDRVNGQIRPDSDIISISGYSLKEHAAYQAECEYILWGNEESQKNVRDTIMMIFGIRLLFNSFFAFTDSSINELSRGSAAVITGAAPYLEPVVEVVIKLGYAGVETANDISKIKQGYGVAILKNKNTWATFPYKAGGDNETVTLDYPEYLRIFLYISLLKEENKVAVLGRIADCIQVNAPDTDLLTSYTMLSVQAEVSSRTTFMRKISDWGESGAWGFPDDYYTISYQSILGY